MKMPNRVNLDELTELTQLSWATMLGRVARRGHRLEHDYRTAGQVNKVWQAYANVGIWGWQGDPRPYLENINGGATRVAASRDWRPWQQRTWWRWWSVESDHQLAKKRPKTRWNCRRVLLHRCWRSRPRLWSWVLPKWRSRRREAMWRWLASIEKGLEQRRR